MINSSEKFSYDDLLAKGYTVISFSENRLATVDQQGHYDIFVWIDEHWHFRAREHSNYKIKL
jgi:hypothetical protein